MSSPPATMDAGSRTQHLVAPTRTEQPRRAGDQRGVLREGRFVQMAMPEDVYHSPADPFVARFTRLAGELAATVHGERTLRAGCRLQRPPPRFRFR